MAMPVAAKFLIPALVVGFVALSGKKPNDAKPGAAPPKPGADSTPPAELLAKIQAAFTAADPAQLRQLADEVERAGFKAQADDMRAFAKKIEEAIRATPTAKPPATPTIPPTSSSGPLPQVSPLPGIVPPLAPSTPGKVTTLPEVVITASPQPTPAAQNAKLLAGKVALMLRNASKGREDQGLVQAFQQQELDANHGPGGSFGTTPGKADGMYGPKSALQLARFYGIVPPKPLYWSKNNWLQDKKNYRLEMSRFAAVDPQRADEWTAAGKVL